MGTNYLKERLEQQELLQSQLESQLWHLKLQQEKQRDLIKFVLTMLWALLLLYISWKCESKLAARRLADSTGSPL
jgi:hypothetical protein